MIYEVRTNKMTYDELIKELLQAKRKLDDSEIKNYDELYIHIRSLVDQYEDSDLEWPFENCNFISWEIVQEQLMEAVKERDDYSLRFLTQHVDYDSDYFYIDAFGYLLNIDKDIMYTLLEYLLEALDYDENEYDEEEDD